MDVDTTVRADGSGTVTVTARADAELVAKVPGLVADLRLDDLKAQGWTVTGPTTGADGGVTVVLTKSFSTPAEATQVLAEISGPAGPLRGLAVTQERTFADVRTAVAGEASLSGLSAFSDAELAAALGAPPLADRISDAALRAGLALTVRYRLPGTVTSTTGKVVGSTVSWTPSLARGARTSLTATASLVDRSARAARSRETWVRWAFWAWIGIVAVLGAVVGVVVWRRRRHRVGERA